MTAQQLRTSMMDRLAGFPRSAETVDSALYNTLVEAQGVRVFQSHHALPLMAITGSIYIYGLWNHTPHLNLILWIGLVAFFAVLRVLVCRRIQQKLADISLRQLYRNELWLFFTSLASTLSVGSGYWFVCYEGSERAVLAVTVFCCIYAIGTTINSSMVYRSFPALLVSNLGQGVLFLLAVRDPVDIEVAVGLLAVMVLLLQFGRRNAEVFSESIRMRDENRAQNIKLEQDRLLVEKALTAARLANEDKNRFLASASHDLRQPLHAMTLFLGSLRHVATSDLAVELIDKIDETSNILRDQFNSLLDLSKFDAGVVLPESSRFPLDGLIENIVDGVRPDARKKDLQVELVTLPLDLETDMLLLERLLRNLVVNAVIYTDSGKVTVVVAERREGVYVSVVDTGPGIAPDDQERIFEDYYQLNNPGRTKRKGTGLGLAIAKRICNVLGFKLTLTSTPGSGSKFSVFIPAKYSFPRAPGISRKPHESIVVDAPLAGLRILLVDDDPVILDALSRLLSLWECKPSVATSSREVRELLHDAEFDLAILDDMLDEEATGLDIARYLASFIPRQRILITTGNMSESRLEEIRGSGFQVLIKPVDHLLLRQSLQALVPDPATA